MKINKTFAPIIFVLSLGFCHLCFSDEIILKSGKKFEGTIVEKTETFVKIKTDEEEITFFNDELAQIPVNTFNPLKSEDDPLRKIPYYHITSFSKASIEKNKNTIASKSQVNLKNKKPKKIEDSSDLTFSTAIITYSIIGYKMGLQTGIGQVIVYIDKKQNKIAAIYTYALNALDKDIVIKTKDVYDGKTIYTANLSSLEGVKLNVTGDILAEFFHHNLYENKQKGSGKTLGRDCKIFFDDKSLAYFWNGIMMKEQPISASKVEFTTAKEAISIKINPTLPEDVFKIPTNIQYKVLHDASKSGTENIIMRQDYLSTPEGKSLQQSAKKTEIFKGNTPGEVFTKKTTNEKIEKNGRKKIISTPSKPSLKTDTIYSSIDNLLVLKIPLSWTWNEQEGDIAITNPEKTSALLINYVVRGFTSKPEAQATFKAMNENILKKFGSSSNSPISDMKDFDFNGISAQEQEFNSSKGRISLINFYTDRHAFAILLATAEEEERLKAILKSFRLKTQP